VEHSCEKCGSPVEDGRPFCPHCRAPQIHVQIAVPEDASALGSAAESTPVRQISIERAPTLEHALFDQSAGTRAALKAGVLGIFLGIVPFLGVILTGWLAVYFYRREKGLVPATSIGSRLGGAAGVVAFAINSLLLIVRIFIFHAQQQYVDGLIKLTQALGYNSSDPDIQSIMHNLVTPSGLALTFVFGMIFAVLLGAAGGALASVVLRHRTRN
jgi:MFS family permease